MLDTEHAVKELNILYHSTLALQPKERMATRIQRIAELVNDRLPTLRAISSDEAMMIANGHMPLSLSHYRTIHSEFVAVWSFAYENNFGKFNTKWLVDIGKLFEWARSNCEEAGELGFEYKFNNPFSRKHARWLRSASVIPP